MCVQIIQENSPEIFYFTHQAKLETEKDFLRQKSELAHAVRVQHGGGSGKEVDDVDVACIEEACAAEKEECMLDVRKSLVMLVNQDNWDSTYVCEGVNIATCHDTDCHVEPFRQTSPKLLVSDSLFKEICRNTNSRCSPSSIQCAGCIHKQAREKEKKHPPLRMDAGLACLMGTEWLNGDTLATGLHLVARISDGDTANTLQLSVKMCG